MKHITKFLLPVLILCLLCGCGNTSRDPIAATTLPVWQFTSMLCQGTPLTVTRLVTEEVSCLHDYSLSVQQMKAIENAELVIMSGAGLEEFLADALRGSQETVDASAGIALLEGGCHHHDEENHEEHHHELDPHIWLSPVCARQMADNICAGLVEKYPQYEDIFNANLATLQEELDALLVYGKDTLADLSSREIITFHDGFAYLAHEFDLEILEAIEEESGSEASAGELIHLIGMVAHHGVKAVFTEINGSTSAASVIAAETGVALYSLDMAMSGDDYFESMYRNIDTLKEALS